MKQSCGWKCFPLVLSFLQYDDVCGCRMTQRLRWRFAFTLLTFPSVCVPAQVEDGARVDPRPRGRRIKRHDVTRALEVHDIRY